MCEGPGAICSWRSVNFVTLVVVGVLLVLNLLMNLDVHSALNFMLIPEELLLMYLLGFARWMDMNVSDLSV